MNAILVKMFATALALSQVTTHSDDIKTRFDPELDKGAAAQLLRDGCAQIRKAFDIEDIKLDDLITTAMDDPKAIAGDVKAFKGIDFNDLFTAYREFCKNEPVDKSPVDLAEVIAFYNKSLTDLPDDAKIKSLKPTGAYVVLDAKGERVTEIFDADQRRLWVPLADIPQHVQKAFVTAEDKRFFQHKGVDERGLIRAFIANLGAPGRPQGGSTITQQVAKNLLVGDDVTYERKIREMIVASRMESMLSKWEILELYLNAIYLGRGAWGVEMASRSYFGKPAKDLTLGEGAMLAGLAKGPNYFSPERHPDRARERLDYVLSRMQSDGAIDESAMKDAQGRLPQVVALERTRRDGGFYFVDQVAREAKALNLAGLGVGASVVRSTVRPDLQRAAEAALQDGLARYEANTGRARFHGPEMNLAEAMGKLGNEITGKPAWQQALEAARLPLADVHWTSAVVLGTGSGGKKSDGGLRVGLADGRVLPLAANNATRTLQLHDVIYVRVSDRSKSGARAELRIRPDVQGAAIVLDNSSGAILAVAGGFSYQLSQLNRATQAQRQPGSTLKPFTYLAALRRGLQPNTMVRDVPVTLPPISGSSGSSYNIMANPDDRNYWTPKNYSGSGGGITTLRRALENSKNLVTANLLDGAIDSSPEQSLRRVCELTMEARVYKECVPYYPFVLGAQPARLVDMAAFYAAVATEGARPSPHVVEAVEQNGKSIYRHDGQAAWLGSADRVAFYQLKTILQGVVARGTAASLARWAPYVAGKTGTSDDENDAWFIGFTNEVTIGVWVGYDNAEGRRTLGGGMTGAKVAIPIFEPIMEAVWRNYAPRTALAGPSLVASRQMAAVPTEYYSGQFVPPGTPNAITEYLRLDGSGRVADTRYNIVSQDEAQWARNYEVGGDGDLFGPYASRSGGGYYPYGQQGGYTYEQGNGFYPPGSVYNQPRRGGLFGGIFGDQRYYEQQEMNRQRQRRVDPDYYTNRFQTN
jgi:penicillin-binding protein 1A